MTREKCMQWLDQLSSAMDYEADTIEVTIVSEASDCLKSCYKADEIKEILEKERDRVPGKISFTPNEVYELLKWRELAPVDID